MVAEVYWLYSRKIAVSSACIQLNYYPSVQMKKCQLDQKLFVRIASYYILIGLNAL